MMSVYPSKVPNLRANQVTIDSSVYAEAGPDTGTICIVTLHDDGSETHEYIDAEVDEKRKAADEEDRRNVRPRFDAPIPNAPYPSTGLSNSHPARPFASAKNSKLFSATQNPIKPDPPPNELSTEKPKAKFSLGSDLHEQIDMEKLTEKVLQTQATLGLNELLGVAQELSESVDSIIRKKRLPIIKPSVVSNNVASSTTIEPEALYACVSGKARATVDNALKADALLDGGSEVCLMPKRIFEKMDLPIDTDIHWRINGYDKPEKARQKAEERGAIRVCHDVRIGVGGVDVNLPIFVVEHSNSDLLLGRPWERLVRAKYDNRDDGSLWVEIR